MGGAIEVALEVGNLLPLQCAHKVPPIFWYGLMFFHLVEAEEVCQVSAKELKDTLGIGLGTEPFLLLKVLEQLHWTFPYVGINEVYLCAL